MAASLGGAVHWSAKLAKEAALILKSKVEEEDAMATAEHFDGQLFFNPWAPHDVKVGDFLKWQLNGQRVSWPKAVPNRATPELAKDLSPGELVVTFINHATFLIQLPDCNIVTDPVWSQRVSPVTWAGPKRVRPPGLAFDKLPPVHLVLVSHNHYDHLDRATIGDLAAHHKPRFFVADGDGPRLRQWGIRDVAELDWWDAVTIREDLSIHYVPAQHWSSRSTLDRNRSLWGGFVIRYRGRSLYFAGDTGYGPHFAWIAKRFAPIDLAFLPIGAYEPRWFMSYHHMNPDDALKAHLDLGARRSVGMHFGCWQLTDEGINQPVVDLEQAMKARGVSRDAFWVPEVGASYRLRVDEAAVGQVKTTG